MPATVVKRKWISPRSQLWQISSDILRASGLLSPPKKVSYRSPGEVGPTWALMRSSAQVRSRLTVPKTMTGRGDGPV